MRGVLRGCVSMCGAGLLDVGSHGGDVAPEGEGRDEPPWWMGEARGEEKAWAAQCGVLGAGARAQERWRAAKAQPAEREHGSWTVRDDEVGAICGIGWLPRIWHWGEHLAELGPRADHPDRLEPDPVAASEGLGHGV